MLVSPRLREISKWKKERGKRYIDALISNYIISICIFTPISFVIVDVYIYIYTYIVYVVDN